MVQYQEYRVEGLVLNSLRAQEDRPRMNSPALRPPPRCCQSERDGCACATFQPRCHTLSHAVRHAAHYHEAQAERLARERAEKTAVVGLSHPKASDTLYPIPYTPYHILYTPYPYTLYPIPYTLYPIPYTLYPIPSYLIPYTPYHIPYNLYHIPEINSP